MGLLSDSSPCVEGSMRDLFQIFGGPPRERRCKVVVGFVSRLLKFQ